jgi:hypothetical protein
MKNVGDLRRLVAALICTSLVLVAAKAQATGTINGSVRDTQGAMVAEATITLVNLETTVTRTATTSKDGTYHFPQVTPGTYELRAEAVGFKKVVRQNLAVQVNTPITLDLTLEVGAVTEAVEVVSGGETINRTDATIGNTFDETQIRQLPIEGRNVVDLLSLQPGVVKTNVDYDDLRSGAVNGARSDQSNVTLDGVDVNDQLGGFAFTSVAPVTLDSVEEFRVITSNANANQGRSSGAQVALVTKSGSNEFHGSVYEFHRNTATTANSFFNNAVPLTGGQPPVERPKLIRNVFGFSVGGPILKDKFFFFLNYEGRRDAAADSVVATVPTESLRAGVVRYLNTSGGVSDITPTELLNLDPAGIGVSPVMLTYLSQFPLPNDTSIGDGLNTLGYRFNAPIKRDFNTYIARADYQINDRHLLFWRGNLADNKSNSAPPFPGFPPRYEYLENSKGMAIGYTAIISDHVTNNFRYGYTRQGDESVGSTNGPFIGFRLLDELQPYTYTEGKNVPVNNFTNDTSWVKGNHTFEFGTNIRYIRFNYLSYYNSFPYVVGSYTWLRDVAAGLVPEDASSSFSTGVRSSAVTLLGLVNDIYIVYNYDRDGSLIPVGEPISRRYAADEYEFYVQDTWKMRPNLTLSYGLRYGLYSPPWETNGLQVAPTTPLADWYNQRTANAAQGIPASASPDIFFDLAGPANDRRGYYDWDKNNFAPRVAVAWSPDVAEGFWAKLTGGPGRTSIRGGFGSFYERIGSGLANSFDFLGATGLSTAVENPTSQYTVATAPRYTGIGAYPPLPPAPPGGFPAALPKDAFSITFAIDDSVRTPIDYSFDFAVARELPWDMSIELAYVGRFGRDRLVQSDIAPAVNLVDPESGMDYYTAANLIVDLVEQGRSIPSVERIPYWENIYPGIGRRGRTSTQEVYRLFSKYASDWVTIQYYLDAYFFSKFGPNAFFDDQYSALAAWRSLEDTSYNAGQVIVRKRFARGLQFDFNYTWSKSMDLTSEPERSGSFGTFSGFVLNSQNPELNRGVSDYDVTHSLNTNWIWQIPVGHDRAFFADSPGWVDAIAGGWQLTGIFRATSGLPVSVDNGSFWPTNWNHEGYATASGDIRGETTRLGDGPNLFANPRAAYASFKPTRPGQIGSRNIIRGDGVLQLDLGLGKDFNMPWEGHKLQFRWEVFNVTNTARFDPQSINLDVTNELTFGSYTGTLSPPRVMQFGLRYEF